MRRFASTLASLLLFAVAGGAGAQDYVFSITFDGGGWFDRSFNEATWTGLTRAVGELSTDYDIDVLIYDGSPDTSAQGLGNIASSGIDLMIAAGFPQVAAIQTVSADHPDAKFVMIDGVVEHPNVRSVLFKEHEGSYVVGYLAGLSSQTKVIGFVGGMDSPLIRAFDLGFQEGVTAACPDCIVLSSYVGPTPAAFNDPARAAEIAAEQHAQGADIIYAAAGNSGNGVIDFVNRTRCFRPQGLNLRSTPLTEAVAAAPKDADYAARCAGAQPLFFIGVDSNQNYLGDVDRDPATMNHGLTSMLKRADVAAETAVHDVVRGTFTGGIQVLGLREGAIGFALDEYNRALIPEGVLERIRAIERSIIEGRLAVPDYRALN